MDASLRRGCSAVGMQRASRVRVQHAQLPLGVARWCQSMHAQVRADTPAQAISYRASGYVPKPAELPHGAPALMSRHISLNPIDTFATIADDAFHRLDLCLAVAVDSLPGLTWATVAINGAAAALGLSLYQQVAAGQPAWLINMLEDQVGPVLVGLPKLALLLGALPLALWHLRTWWEANTEAARELIGGPLCQGLTTGAVVATVLRLLPLVAAFPAAASAEPRARLLSVLLVLASLVPLAAAAFMSLGQEQKGAQQAADSVKAALPLLLPVVAADVALVAAAAALSASAHMVAASCGVVFAACLAATVNQAKYADRMHLWRASVGDAADVHVTVRSESGAVIDTSAAKEPMHITVGQEVSAASDDSAASAEPLSREGAHGTARFRTPAFATLLDELVPGLVVGERVAITVHNPFPHDGGFINPDLVWWQSNEDMGSKFKQGTPEPGQVFWYPLGPGPNDNWSPVRVNATNDSFTELDGNEAIENAPMVVEVQLLKLTKQQ